MVCPVFPALDVGQRCDRLQGILKPCRDRGYPVARLLGDLLVSLYSRRLERVQNSALQAIHFFLIKGRPAIQAAYLAGPAKPTLHTSVPGESVRPICLPIAFRPRPCRASHLQIVPRWPMSLSAPCAAPASLTPTSPGQSGHYPPQVPQYLRSALCQPDRLALKCGNTGGCETKLFSIAGMKADGTTVQDSIAGGGRTSR